MLWLILEACGALLLLVFIVWWTMFSGRKGHDERPAKARAPSEDSGER